jgi:hypothetical protein
MSAIKIFKMGMQIICPSKVCPLSKIQGGKCPHLQKLANICLQIIRAMKNCFAWNMNEPKVSV